ncbi:hypothetical protein [Paracoccus sp. J55]|uniref:hypothetical protein n=1 Tax=Paracoccus sp. J55 TaxID=935849 RepID=UPI0012EB7C93|nr:hypothetical protein [Paracoccus sp. J55]
MTFDFDAALAEILAEPVATSATFATSEQNQVANAATNLRHTCDTAGHKVPCRNGVAAVSQDKALNNNECRNVANVASQIIPRPGRSYSPEAVRQDVAAEIQRQAGGMPPRASAPSRAGDAEYPYGVTAGGYPRIWTGRPVSVAEWRNMSEWERHGPKGLMLCGICRTWVDAFPACHEGQQRGKHHAS